MVAMPCRRCVLWAYLDEVHHIALPEPRAHAQLHALGLLLLLLYFRRLLLRLWLRLGCRRRRLLLLLLRLFCGRLQGAQSRWGDI